MSESKGLWEKICEAFATSYIFYLLAAAVLAILLGVFNKIFS